MKIIALYLLKHNGDNPFIIHVSEDLSFLSFFKRPFFRPHMNFGARAATKNIKIGERNKIDLKEIPYFAYVHCLSTKLVGLIKCNIVIFKGLVLCDAEYP
jgi:synaptobrevin family protein YKT6